MTSKFKKVLYVGAWDHIEVINYFPHCNEFILIDTQPRSDHDKKDYFYEGFYRANFLKKIIKKCKKYGFILDKTIELDNNYLPHYNDYPYINPHLFIFIKNNISIKFYISTNILFNMCPMLEKDIFEADTLYNAGYHPDCELLKYFSSDGIIKKKNFVGDNNTCYYVEYEEDDNNIIKKFIENNNYHMDDYFDNYYLVWRKKSMIILCDNLGDIDEKKTFL